MRIFFFLVVVLFTLQTELHAACDAKATGSICFTIGYVNYGEDTPNPATIVVQNYVSATGHYGGGCRTHVGRGKARGRACDRLEKSFYTDYHTWKGQADFVCNMALRTGSVVPGGRVNLNEIVSRTQWMRVLDFKLIDRKTENGDACGDGGAAGGSLYPNEEVDAKTVLFYCKKAQAFMYQD